MPRNPTISLVTSVSGETAFLPQTIESVLAQDYPNVEHVVVDGTTAATGKLQSQYSHLKVIRGPGGGPAEAINAGFAAASGEIFGLLQAGDILEPGALRAVAETLAAGRGQVAAGRCRLVNAAGEYFGVECPNTVESCRRLLEIWKGRSIGQPAVYWTREAWDACGPLRVDAPPSMLLYDLFCRLSRQHAFHRLDRVLVRSRLVPQSDMAGEERRLEEAVAISRRYWGTLFGIQYWQLLASYIAFRANRQNRAARLMRDGRQLLRERKYGTAVGKILLGGAVAPGVGLDVAVAPVKRAAAKMRSQMNRPPRRRNADTKQWLRHTSLHDDGWAGPTLEQRLTVESQHATLALSGTVSVGHLRRNLELEAFLDGRPLGRSRVGRAGPFAVTWNLDVVQPGPHQFRIRANTFAVPHEYSGNLDYRPLSYRVVQLELGRRAQRPS